MCRVNQPPQRARRRCFRKRTCSAAGISMTIREGTADTANDSERWHFLREQKPHPLCHASRAHCPILYVERFRSTSLESATKRNFLSRYTTLGFALLML